MKVSDFDYPLDESLIAQTPILKRDESRLMVLSRKTGEVSHKKFYDIIDYLNKKYLYCVLVDEDDIPTQEYKYVEVINENNETYIEEVNDEKILENLVNLVTINYLNDSTNEEQAA